MLWRSMPLVALLPLAGCASAPSHELFVSAGREPGWRAVEQPAAKPAAAAYEIASLPEPARASAPVEPAFAMPPPAPGPQNYSSEDASLRRPRFTIKAGYYDLSDADELDDGWIVNFSWMQFLSKMFAIEYEVGYFDADGSEGIVDADAWGIPFMMNGRINLPIWKLDAYAGLGIGTMYFDAEADGGVISISEDGFLAAGNGYFGASLNIGEALALGLEGKYYVTDEMSGFDEGLDAFALMATLGFRR